MPLIPSKTVCPAPLGRCQAPDIRGDGPATGGSVCHLELHAPGRTGRRHQHVAEQLVIEATLHELLQRSLFSLVACEPSARGRGFPIVERYKEKLRDIESNAARIRSLLLKPSIDEQNRTERSD